MRICSRNFVRDSAKQTRNVKHRIGDPCVRSQMVDWVGKNKNYVVTSRRPSVTPCVHHEPISPMTAPTQPLLSFHHFNTTSVPLGFPLVSPLPSLSLPPNHFLFLSMLRSHKVVQRVGTTQNPLCASHEHLVHSTVYCPLCTRNPLMQLAHTLLSSLHSVT